MAQLVSISSFTETAVRADGFRCMILRACTGSLLRSMAFSAALHSAVMDPAEHSLHAGSADGRIFHISLVHISHTSEAAMSHIFWNEITDIYVVIPLLLPCQAGWRFTQLGIPSRGPLSHVWQGVVLRQYTVHSVRQK